MSGTCTNIHSLRFRREKRSVINKIHSFFSSLFCFKCWIVFNLMSALWWKQPRREMTREELNCLLIHKCEELSLKFLTKENVQSCWFHTSALQITVGLWTWGGHSTEMTTENPLWVGAWWIGFLAGGAAALLIAFPILGYPRQLPGNCAVPFIKMNEASTHLYLIAVIVVMKKMICLCLFLQALRSLQPWGCLKPTNLRMEATPQPQTLSLADQSKTCLSR